MGTYGRNFEFRIPPTHGQRAGRYAVPSTGTAIPIGAPILATPAGTATSLGMQPVTLVTGATNPVKGASGILVYEWGPAAFAGDDPYLTTYSDKDYAPLGAAVQMVSGNEVKVVFKNTAANTFLINRVYAGKIMVAGLGATPTLAVGDYLTPGVGDSTSGFWAKGNATNGWFNVTSIDVARQEVEGRMTF